MSSALRDGADDGQRISDKREEQTMSKEEALKAFEQMLSEIDKDNWLFVGTINPQMVEWAIKALKGADDE